MALANQPTKLKLLIIGESAVGKSSLLMQFADQTFPQTFISTVGIDFKKKVVDIDGETLLLEIWDTAGQERFQSISLAYVRGGQGIILCYDITSLESFHRVHRWYKKIKELCLLHVDIILVGTKLDLESNRKVPVQEAMEFAAEHGMLYLETSAKNNIHVDQAFLALAKIVAKRLDNGAQENRTPAAVDVKKQQVHDHNSCGGC